MHQLALLMFVQLAINPNPALAKATSGLTLTTLEAKEMLTEALSGQKSIPEFWSNLDRKYGQVAVLPYLKIASDEKERDELRWASLYGIARMRGKQSLPLVRPFARHKNWLLRDAALKAMAALSATEMQSEFEYALKDKALVIRTTAVDVISHLRLQSCAPKLVEALFDPINYRREKPLWIHQHILTALREMNYKRATPRLVDLLESKKDPALRTHIIQTLEHLTGKSFATKTMSEQIYLWRRNTVSEATF